MIHLPGCIFLPPRVAKFFQIRIIRRFDKSDKSKFPNLEFFGNSWRGERWILEGWSCSLKLFKMTFLTTFTSIIKLYDQIWQKCFWRSHFEYVFLTILSNEHCWCGLYTFFFAAQNRILPVYSPVVGDTNRFIYRLWTGFFATWNFIRWKKN